MSVLLSCVLGGVSWWCGRLSHGSGWTSVSNVDVVQQFEVVANKENREFSFGVRSFCGEKL